MQVVGRNKTNHKKREEERVWWGLPLQTRGQGSPLWHLNEVPEWGTGLSGEVRSWAEETANSKALNLERSWSCLRNNKNNRVVRKAWALCANEEGGQGGRWGHITEGLTGHCKDLGLRNPGSLWAREWHNRISLTAMYVDNRLQGRKQEVS